MAKVREVDPKLIKELREDDDLSWADIAEQVDLPAGKCMYLYEVATTTPKTKISGRTEEELKRAIVSARDDDNLSWGIISARSGRPEGWVRRVYEEITGTLSRGLRVGKGGRYPSKTTPTTPPSKTPKPKAEKVSKAVKKATGKQKTASAKAEKPVKAAKATKKAPKRDKESV